VQPGSEDSGIASVEALAAGTPIVALGRGGILDIVDDGVHGILYQEADDVDSLVAAIDKSLNFRFNEVKLKSRARSFSTIRFSARIRSAVARCLTEPEVSAYDPKPSS